MLRAIATHCLLLLNCAALSPWSLAQSAVCDEAMSSFRAHQWTTAADRFADCEAAQPGQTAALLYRGKSFINLARFDEAADVLQAYLSRHPQSDDAIYSLAYVRFRQDRPRESLELFNQAARLKAPGADDLKIVSLDYVLLHDYNDAARYLEGSLKLDPDNLEARYHLGRARYQLNQFDQAIAAFQEVLRRDPGNVKAEDNLGLSYEAENQVESAVAAYQSAIKLDESSATHNEQPYLDLGALLAKSNRSSEAIPILKRATEIDPTSAKAQYELARASFNLGQMKEGRVAAEAAVRLEPRDSSYHYLLGRIYQKLGAPELASEQFKNTETLIQQKKENSAAPAQQPASGVNPPQQEIQKAVDSGGTPDANIADSLRAQARADVQAGDFEKALSLLLQARKVDPKNPAILYEFGIVALHLSLFPDASQAFTETLTLRRDDPDALYGLGRAEIGLTKYQEARETFERYLQIRPQDASAHYAQGLALAALQLSAEARKQFETSIQQQPQQTESYFQLGLLQLEDGQLENAAGNFKRVMDRDPHHAGALTGLGRVAFEKKDYPQAVAFLHQAIAANSTLRQAHYYLGLAYSRMGQKEDSATELALASKIEHEEAEKQRLGLKIIEPNQK